MHFIKQSPAGDRVRRPAGAETEGEGREEGRSHKRKEGHLLPPTEPKA